MGGSSNAARHGRWRRREADTIRPRPMRCSNLRRHRPGRVERHARAPRWRWESAQHQDDYDDEENQAKTAANVYGARKDGRK